MEKIEFTKDEHKVVQDYLNGVNIEVADDDVKKTFMDVLDRAKALINEMGDEAFDDMIDNYNADLIRWYVGQYKKQKTQK